MDENEKTTAMPDGNDEELDSLDRELEELREKFQQQLDEETAKAMAGEEQDTDETDGEPTEQMLIQPLDEIIDEPEEERQPVEQAKLCECCGEKPCDTSFGKDYPYCSECRSLMKANPINLSGILALIIMIIVCAGAIFFSADVVDDYDTLLIGNEAYSEKRLTDAVTYYKTYLSSKTSDDRLSMKAVRNTIDAMTVLGYYADADSLISTYLSESRLSTPRYKKYAEIQREYQLLTETSTVINENFSDVLNGEEFDYEQSIAKADELIAQNKESGEYSQSFLEYAKYLIMMVHKDDEKALLEQLRTIEQVDEGKHPWIYLTYILNSAAKLGDEELAKEYFDKSISINTQEMSIYISYADVFRFGQTPDPDKMLEVANQAAEICSQNAYPTYYRIYALAYLLKGDGENAMSSMEQYMQNCQATLADFNLYAVCALYTKDEDTYADIESTLDSYGYEVGSTVKKYKSGKLTLEQVLTDNGGEI